MPKKLISNEDLYRLQVLSGPQISPDGQTIVYSVQRVDKKTEKNIQICGLCPPMVDNHVNLLLVIR